MKWQEIPGWLEEADVEVFASLKLPKRPVIFECGTYCGKSATAFLELLSDAKVYTCDPVDEPARLPGKYEFFNQKGIDVRWDKPIDLLFIDDSHFYDDVKANFEKLEPFVKPGGYVLFHDVTFETGDVEGLKRFVRELGDRVEIRLGKYGIGILRK